jgi:hypothetical protein
VSIEDELKKEIALLTRENQQLTHQLFDYRAAFIRARDREWVGLTDGDVHDAFNFVEFVKQISFDRDRPEWCESFAAYLEAKLKEKNNG